MFYSNSCVAVWCAGTIGFGWAQGQSFLWVFCFGLLVLNSWVDVDNHFPFHHSLSDALLPRYFLLRQHLKLYNFQSLLNLIIIMITSIRSVYSLQPTLNISQSSWTEKFTIYHGPACINFLCSHLSFLRKEEEVESKGTEAQGGTCPKSPTRLNEVSTF